MLVNLGFGGIHRTVVWVVLNSQKKSDGGCDNIYIPLDERCEARRRYEERQERFRKRVGAPGRLDSGLQDARDYETDVKDGLPEIWK